MQTQPNIARPAAQTLLFEPHPMRAKPQTLRRLYLMALAAGLALSDPCSKGQIQALLALAGHLHEPDPNWILQHVKKPELAVFRAFRKILHQPVEDDPNLPPNPEWQANAARSSQVGAQHHIEAPTTSNAVDYVCRSSRVGAQRHIEGKIQTSTQEQVAGYFALRNIYWLYRFDLAWLLTADGCIYPGDIIKLGVACDLFGFEDNELPASAFLPDFAIALRKGNRDIGHLLFLLHYATPHPQHLQLLALAAGLRKVEITANIPPEFRHYELRIERQARIGDDLKAGETIAQLGGWQHGVAAQINATLLAGAEHGIGEVENIGEFYRCPVSAPYPGILAEYYVPDGAVIQHGQVLAAVYELPTGTHISITSPSG